MTPPMPRGATATIVFTDLVGSTELLSRLGEAGFDALRRTHFSALQRAVETAGGEQVKTLGDGMLAVFPSAADAVACAVAVQQAADGQARTGSVPVAVRVGVALGDVSFENGDVFGTPVVEAARLVAAAAPGQILCTHLVRAVAGGRSGATFTEAGLLELKGLPEPVPVCEVAWEPAVEAEEAAPIPLPPLLCGLGRIFVGREDELDRLAQLWKESAAGERRVALFGGEPGIGKTRLAAELATRVHADGNLVLAGRCDEDLGVPFQPFVEALRHYAGHAVPPRFGRYGADLIRLVPEIGDGIPVIGQPLHSDPETERYRLFDAVAAWLGDVSADGPVLLVLDDVHWAAKPTLMLLRHLLRSSEPLRLLVVVTYRDTDLTRSHPLGEFLADLRREVGVERFPLGGLEREAVGAYIQAVAGHTLPESDDAFVRAVWAETEGNPFFVVEVCRHLAESGAIVQRDGRWVTTAPVDELGIPEGVRDVVGRRLSRLSDATNPILAVASVVGLEFEPVVVGRAGGFDEEELLSALEEAAGARLVAEVDGRRFRFAHALVRATLYDELSGPRRVILHRRVAEAIEAVHANHLDDHLPALAHHWARAAAPAAETDRAVEYATRAGDRALAQLAHDEAASYYGQALELLAAVNGTADEGRRLGLLLALGEAQRQAGNAAHRETLLTAASLARDRQDAAALSRAALANTRAMIFSQVGGVDAERVHALEAALAGSEPDDTALRARLLATLALELTFAKDERHFRFSDEALATARRSGDPATLAGVLLARFYTINTPATLPERLADTAELVGLSDDMPDPAFRCRAAFVRLRCVLEAGKIDEAEVRFDTAEALTAELGQPTLLWTAGWNRTSRLLRLGRLAEAEAAAISTHEVGQASGQPDASAFFAVQLSHVRRDQGRLDEQVPPLREAVERFPGVWSLRPLLAEACCEAGCDDEARRILDDLAADRFGQASFDLLWMSAMASCAAVAVHLGDTITADVIRGLLSPYADQVVVTASAIFGAATHHLGLLAAAVGRYDEAERHFAAAEATHERMGVPAWLARTRLEWARMLLQREQPPDGARAPVLLGQAHATAVELGLRAVERQATELLGGRRS